MNYRGLAKGKIIELTERLPFPEGQPLSVSVEAWPPRARAGSPRAVRQSMHASPRLAPAEVGELDAAMEQSKMSRINPLTQRAANS